MAEKIVENAAPAKKVKGAKRARVAKSDETEKQQAVKEEEENEKPLFKAKELLENPEVIVEAVCVYERLMCFGDWIKHSQGRTHTLTGLDLDEIDAYRKTCNAAAAAAESDIHRLPSLYSEWIARDSILGDLSLGSFWLCGCLRDLRGARAEDRWHG